MVTSIRRRNQINGILSSPCYQRHREALLSFIYSRYRRTEPPSLHLSRPIPGLFFLSVGGLFFLSVGGLFSLTAGSFLFLLPTSPASWCFFLYAAAVTGTAAPLCLLRLSDLAGTLLLPAPTSPECPFLPSASSASSLVAVYFGPALPHLLCKLLLLASFVNIFFIMVL
ncbi:hypothetical protein LXL04_004447 [Taraxacum kok-saghyz]